MQISIELLVKQLQGIPGIHITIEHDGLGADTSFRDYAERWLQTYKRGKVKANTYRSTYFEPVMLHLIPYFQDASLQCILPDDVQVFFNSLQEKLALETQKKIRNCLYNIFAVAMENGLCAQNPVTKRLSLISQIPPQEKHAWSQAQYDIAWNFAKGHEHGLDIMVLMETGITRSELLGLTFDDVDVAGRCLNIRNGLVQVVDSDTGHTRLVHDGLKNSHRFREIPISSELTIALSKKPRVIYVGNPPRRISPGFFFYSPRGGAFNPRNWYKRVFSHFMDALCEEHPEVTQLTTHELRHTRATLLSQKNVDLYAIANLLGHSDLDMLSKRYLHKDINVMREALKVL